MKRMHELHHTCTWLSRLAKLTWKFNTKTWSNIITPGPSSFAFTSKFGGACSRPTNSFSCTSCTNWKKIVVVLIKIFLSEFYNSQIDNCVLSFWHDRFWVRTDGGGALRFIDIKGGGCEVLTGGALTGVRGRTKFPRAPRCLVCAFAMIVCMRVAASEHTTIVWSIYMNRKAGQKRLYNVWVKTMLTVDGILRWALHVQVQRPITKIKVKNSS